VSTQKSVAAFLALMFAATLSANSAIAADDAAILDNRVFINPACSVSDAPTYRSTSAALVASELTNIAVGTLIKFSAGMIKGFGSEKWTKHVVTQPIRFYSAQYVDPDAAPSATPVKKDVASASLAGSPMLLALEPDSPAPTPPTNSGQAPKEEPVQQTSLKVSLNGDWKCIIFVRGRFGDASKRDVTWVNDHPNAAYLQEFNLVEEPEIYFEGEVQQNEDKTHFYIRARHFKVKRNQDWSLITGRRDFVLAFQFALASATNAQTIDAQRSPGRIADAAYQRTGFALGAIPLTDTEAPFDLPGKALGGKTTGWMPVPDKPTLTASLDSERTALAQSCEELLKQVLAANLKDGWVLNNVTTECAVIMNNVGRAKDLITLVLSPAHRDTLKKSNLWVVEGNIAKEIADLNTEKATLEARPQPKQPDRVTEIGKEVIELQREKSLIAAAIDLYKKKDAYTKKQEDLANERKVTPVDLTIAFVETRGAVQWLNSLSDTLGGEIEKKADSWATQISSAIAPSPAEESKAESDRVAAQQAALEAYGALVTSLAAFNAETDATQKAVKYQKVVGDRLGYQDKLRLLREKGGNLADLPPVPALPTPP